MTCFTGIIFGVLMIVGCGTANVNKIFGSKDESTSGLMQRAQFAFDRGDFDLAEELATKAYEGSENNGAAAILLSNVMLSKAGIDVFQLVSKLAEASQSTTGTTRSTATTGDCVTTSTDAAGSISKLSCLLLNLSEADTALLGTDEKLTSAGLKSLGTYYKPAEITDELRQKISILKYTDKGIRYLCPFVNRSVVLKDSIDERHAIEKCGDKSATEFNAVKVHISFALLHLVETLVYQRGVLVDGLTSASGVAKNGISTMSSSISVQNFSSVTDFVATMTEFKKVVDSLADTSNIKSQIALALDGLTVVANAFGASGVPSKVTASITGGLSKIKETASKLSNAAGGAASGNYQAQALKGQINEQYSKTVASKIKNVCGSGGDNCSVTQKTEVCASYAGISQGVLPATAAANKPSFCP
ncbi:MAG: hypothetical protein NTV34_08885 [Proteobacteria bacterium]|nr:hypothetical protein [Pseudomonadota bacterium]